MAAAPSVKRARVASPPLYARRDVADTPLLRERARHAFANHDDGGGGGVGVGGPLPLAIHDGLAVEHLPSSVWWKSVLEHAETVAAFRRMNMFTGSVHYLKVFVAGGAIAALVDGTPDGQAASDLDIFVTWHANAGLAAAARGDFFNLVSVLRRAVCETIAAGGPVVCQGNSELARISCNGGRHRIDIILRPVSDDKGVRFESFLDTFDLWPTRIALTYSGDVGIDARWHLVSRRSDRTTHRCAHTDAARLEQRIVKYEARGYAVRECAVVEGPCEKGTSGACCPREDYDGAPGPAKAAAAAAKAVAATFCCGCALDSWTHRVNVYYEGDGRKRVEDKGQLQRLSPYGFFNGTRASVYADAMDATDRALVPRDAEGAPQLCARCFTNADASEHGVWIRGIAPARLLMALWEESDRVLYTKLDPFIVMMRDSASGLNGYPPTDEVRRLAADIAACKEHVHVDYLKGRVMKLHFDPATPDVLNARFYNRDVDEGAMQRVVARLRGA